MAVMAQLARSAKAEPRVSTSNTTTTAGDRHQSSKPTVCVWMLRVLPGDRLLLCCHPYTRTTTTTSTTISGSNDCVVATPP
jgi:hypothetical protein